MLSPWGFMGVWPVPSHGARGFNALLSPFWNSVFNRGPTNWVGGPTSDFLGHLQSFLLIKWNIFFNLPSPPPGYIYYMKRGRFDWIELTSLSKVDLSYCTVVISRHPPCTLDCGSSKAGGMTSLSFFPQHLALYLAYSKWSTNIGIDEMNKWL